MRSVKLDLSGEWDAEFDVFLAERIYEFNSRATGLFDGRALVGRISDASDHTIAGVTGHTWGGTCQVTYLWVQEAHRRRGLGRALLGAVEVEARRRDCIQVVLATHTFQAAGFYDALGYSQHAAIRNYPIGHAQLLYVKQLAACGGA